MAAFYFKLGCLVFACERREQFGRNMGHLLSQVFHLTLKQPYKHNL